MKSKKQKQPYSLLQNVGWMLSIGWNTRRRGLTFCLLMAIADVLANVSQLYIAPGVLSLVEQHAPLQNLLGTILFFTLALLLTMGGKAYLEEVNCFCLVEIRDAIIQKILLKSLSTAYPNTMAPAFLRLKGKANEATSGNREATEEIFRTLTALLTNVGGLILYTTILSGLNGWLLLFMALTCLGEFAAARYKDNWYYAHRDEENQFYNKKSYLRGKAESISFAKDIRIFGL